MTKLVFGDADDPAFKNIGALYEQPDLDTVVRHLIEPAYDRRALREFPAHTAVLEQMYYDRLGRPINLGQWMTRFIDLRYRIVRQSRIRQWWVSTIWTGHPPFSFYPTEPRVYETMVFPLKARRRGSYQVRSATTAQAIKTHSDVCRMIRSGWRG